MKIKKYIAAIVLAMSLTTGLVFANAKGNDVLKTHVLAFNFKGANMPEDNQQPMDATKVVLLLILLFLVVFIIIAFLCIIICLYFCSSR